MTFGLSACAIAGIVGAGAAVYSASKAGQPSSQSTTTQQNQLDPRMQNILYGDGQKTLNPGAKPIGTDENGNPTYAASDYTTNGGLLSQFQSYLNQPQAQGLQNFGSYNNTYMTNDAPYDMGQQRNSSWDLAKSNFNAPNIQAAQGGYTSPMNVAQSGFPQGRNPQTAGANIAQASMINAPNQNGMNLNPALNSLINGNLGNNPYLAGSIQKGINQSNASFQNDLADVTRNLNENVLPQIRSEAIANGQYGGSRQGIAEGKALQTFNTQTNRALSQVGQNQTDAAVQAQAGQYGQDRQNQLNAVQGISGQQYNVAGQNAGYQNQAALSNAGMLNNMGQFNAGVGNNYLSQLLQNSQFNAGAQNSAAQQQYAGNQGMNLANLGNQQQSNMQNASNIMNTNQLNSQNKATGVGLLGNLVGQQYGYAQNQNNYGINRAGQVNGLISPYTGYGQSQTMSQPLYTNQGANALGGALAGAQLYRQFGGSFGGGNQNQNSGGNDGWTQSNGESLVV